MIKKDYFWNNYRGILILLIVFGQFLYTYASKLNGSAADVIYTALNTFCMPAFVFSYGYKSKSCRARSKISQTMLLLYYLLFNTAMMLLMFFVKDQKAYILHPFNVYWFVLSLILWRACIEPLSKIKGIIPISVAAALLIGFWGEFSNILSIRRTIAYFIFFLLGYRFKREQFKKMLRSRSVRKYLIALAVTCVGVVVLILIVKRFTITNTMLEMGAYKKPVQIIHRIFLMAVSMLAIIMLMMLTPNANLSLLTTFGRNSLLIYMTHRFAAMVFSRFLSYKKYGSAYLIYAAVAAIFTCALFGDNRLNRFVNNTAEQAALHIVNSDTKGRCLQTGILIGLLVIMTLIPLLEII